MFSTFYNLGSIFLTTYFKHFVFIELFDLNSNLNNLFESSSNKDSFVDSSANFLFSSTIKICILPISTKILKFSLAGLILINTQPNSFSNAFCLSISQPISLSLCPYILENIHQFYNLKHCVEISFLQLKIVFIFVSINCS